MDIESVELIQTRVASQVSSSLTSKLQDIGNVAAELRALAKSTFSPSPHLATRAEAVEYLAYSLQSLIDEIQRMQERLVTAAKAGQVAP